MKLNPTPGYAVKTSDGTSKVFINVCTDPQVPPPDTLNPAEVLLRVQQDKDWVVPIVVSPERQELDKSGKPAKVWDCCMNPQVLKLGIEDPGIKVLTIETCLELVEDAAHIQLDRNYALPKLKARGTLQHTEVSENAFSAPKTLEQLVQIQEPAKTNLSGQSLQNLGQRESPEGQSKMVIQELSETKSDYYLHVYRGLWSGEGPRPNYELEFDGMRQKVYLDGEFIICDGIKVKVGSMKRAEAFFTKDDDTLHIFLWS